MNSTDMKAPILLSLLLTVPSAWGDIYLNEIRFDQPGADNDEYFEIFSTDPANDSLADVALIVLGDGTGGSGIVESVTSLAGSAFTTSYFLVAESGFTLGTPDLVVALNFENSDNVTCAVVRGFTGVSGDDLDTDDDGVLDSTPWTALLDGVSLSTGIAYPDGDHTYVQLGPMIGPDGAIAPGHIYRSLDGGAWQIGRFDPDGGDDTPGAANPSAIPEPSSHALLALGLGALLLRRPRR
ncbi:MAG: PEP-CTERM sorting domain-containing protein [Verrucomicrobiales bacterium]|nr:PEP-CTERM sorting domain-containing protein [Verrucomicrobiales bacterium]